MNSKSLNLVIAASLGLSLLVATPFSAAAQPYPEGSDKLMAKLAELLPDLPIESVVATPMAGFFVVELEGGQNLYGSADGEYLFSGDMYRLTSEVENLAETRRMTKRRALLEAEPLENMVVFSPAGETKSYISVFTDVDCGYCRKLHQEIADINALGIEVRYLGYPRGGLGTPTHAKIVSAWCADEPTEALTALKSGLNIDMKDCKNPIAEQYDLGRKVGVTGTPAIVTADGRLLPGYMPAAALAEAIGLN